MTESESPTPLKQQLAVLALIVVLGLIAYVATRGNPYETPQLTFRTCMDAIARRDADAAWDCVDGTDRTKCGFIARRSGRVGAGDDPLQALFDQGVERYPDLGEAVLESVTPTQDPDRVEVDVLPTWYELRIPVWTVREQKRHDRNSESETKGATGDNRHRGCSFAVAPPW